MTLYRSSIGGSSTTTSTARSGLTVTFHGVRGSTPCHGSDIVRYGGNTSCVSLDIDGQDPIVFDLGTGLRYFGELHPPTTPFRGSCLLSHLHWDHIQGLPFFTPLLREGSEVQVYAPIQEEGVTVEQVFATTIKPPVFPIHYALLPGDVSFHEVGDTEFEIGDIEVMSRSIPHVGPTVGYRVSHEGASVAYLSDHQQPLDGSYRVTEGALELCRDADLVIHDAQYTQAEFAEKRDWGHCTVEFAIAVAAEAGASRLALFHHDPAHHDDMLDAITADAAECGRRLGVDVISAREGLRVIVGS